MVFNEPDNLLLKVKLPATRRGFPGFNFIDSDACLLTPLTKRGLRGMKPASRAFKKS
jgi:hypothetical protein